jgi:hypothetical protein
LLSNISSVRSTFSFWRVARITPTSAVQLVAWAIHLEAYVTGRAPIPADATRPWTDRARLDSVSLNSNGR